MQGTAVDPPYGNNSAHLSQVVYPFKKTGWVVVHIFVIPLASSSLYKLKNQFLSMPPNAINAALPYSCPEMRNADGYRNQYRISRKRGSHQAHAFNGRSNRRQGMTLPIRRWPVGIWWRTCKRTLQHWRNNSGSGGSIRLFLALILPDCVQI